MVGLSLETRRRGCGLVGKWLDDTWYHPSIMGVWVSWVGGEVVSEPGSFSTIIIVIVSPVSFVRRDIYIPRHKGVPILQTLRLNSRVALI